MRSLVVTAAALCASFVASCASSQVTWEDAAAQTAAPTTQRAVIAAAAARSPASVEEPKGPSVGIRIDRALQRFVNARVEGRLLPKTSLMWGQHWLVALDEIGDACQSPPRASDLGAFVRARVTLEVELDADRRRGILLPDDLHKRVRNVLVAVDESVGYLRAANAPGTLKPMPRLEEGDLILRVPVVPAIVSSPFGVRPDPFTGQRRFHAGADFDAPHGSTVYAAASGLVVYAGSQGGYGKHVVIDHGDGVRTHYSHMSEIVVMPGESVNEGDGLGYVGSTGRSTGPHLHFAVTNADGEFLDPVAVIDVPFKVLEKQVKVGPKNRKQSFKIKNTGTDSVEILATQ